MYMGVPCNIVGVGEGEGEGRKGGSKGRGGEQREKGNVRVANWSVVYAVED